MHTSAPPLATRVVSQVPPVSPTAWDDLGLSEDVYQHVFHETELMFEEVSRVLLTNE